MMLCLLLKPTRKRTSDRKTRGFRFLRQGSLFQCAERSSPGGVERILPAAFEHPSPSQQRSLNLRLERRIFAGLKGLSPIWPPRYFGGHLDAHTGRIGKIGLCKCPSCRSPVEAGQRAVLGKSTSERTLKCLLNTSCPTTPPNPNQDAAAPQRLTALCSLRLCPGAPALDCAEKEVGSTGWPGQQIFDHEYNGEAWGRGGIVFPWV